MRLMTTHAATQILTWVSIIIFTSFKVQDRAIPCLYLVMGASASN